MINNFGRIWWQYLSHGGFQSVGWRNERPCGSFEWQTNWDHTWDDQCECFLFEDAVNWPIWRICSCYRLKEAKKTSYVVYLSKCCPSHHALSLDKGCLPRVEKEMANWQKTHAESVTLPQILLWFHLRRLLFNWQLFFFYEYARGHSVLNGRVTFSGLAYLAFPPPVSRATSSCTRMFPFPSYMFSLTCHSYRYG